ncbi:phage tail protein [Ectopseudomonas mendocina]|uniref:phage tail protein n=1 Tax=Ectopseudomonas mendocina TaxID=300 RepID=UPI00376F341B
MGASITIAGESLIAQKQGAQQILTVSRFILANVPGLDPNGPVDRAAGKPAAGQIVGTYNVTQAGYVNPNQVVYSLMLGSDIGDFDWNWIGLETAENVLLMVAYVPTQQKRRNIPPLQLGNNVTRNFLMVFDGAQALTGLTIDASTWQHDFTVRLAGIDERERQSNRDIFGRACFFGSALQLEKVGGAYQLKPGTAYVEGVRLQRAAALPVIPPAFPTTAWLDVALQRELSDVVASWSVVWGAGKVDYVDSAGVQHYCVAIADLPNSNTITDSRPVENIAGPLVAHFAARVGDYAGLRARATTKDDVGLGNLPNAKSDDPSTNSSEILATTKAVKIATAPLSTGVSPGIFDLVQVNEHGHITSGARQKVVGPLSVDTVLTANDRGLVLLDASAGNRVFVLPVANAALGVVDLYLRRVDGSVNSLLLTAQGGGAIMHRPLNVPTGSSSYSLVHQGETLHLRSDLAGRWWVIGDASIPASLALAIAGTDTRTFINPEVLLAMLNRLPFILPPYISPLQSITLGGGYTLPHGLNTQPKSVIVVAICQEAERNWRTGDVVMVPPFSDAYTVSSGLAVSFDSDNCYIRIGAQYAFALHDRLTGAAGWPTPARWKFQAMVIA